MMNFPHEEFGHALASGYSASIDFSLMRSQMTSDWVRQRRGYTHAASLITLSFPLTIKKSKDLVDWLQDNDDWFDIELISGDYLDSACSVYPVTVRRTTTVSCARVELSDAMTVTFQVETYAKPNYEQSTLDAAGKPAYIYPSQLPLPQASGFASEHADRNITKYTLSYQMNTSALKVWQEFASFAGTAWFKHFMVSTNTYGDYEVIRYTSSPNVNLIRPDTWEVTIEAEGYPNRGYLAEFATDPIAECSYDYPIDYDDVTEDYDCSGGSGIPPTQGSFTMPNGTVIISASASGAAPQTATASIVIYRNGSIVCSPASNPVWTQWHTDADTLIIPALTINSSVEVSTDGLLWAVNIPGTRYSLKTQDIYIRSVHTDSVSNTRALSVLLQFDDGTSTYALTSAAVQLSTTLSIDAGGIIPAFDWADYAGSFDSIASAGIQVRPDGTCAAASSGTYTNPWYVPTTSGIGNDKWLVINKTSGNGVINNNGIRLNMGTNLTYTMTGRNPSGIQELTVSFFGSCSIYSAQSGGILLGQGNINLEVTLYGSEIPP